MGKWYWQHNSITVTYSLLLMLFFSISKIKKCSAVNIVDTIIEKDLYMRANFIRIFKAVIMLFISIILFFMMLLFAIGMAPLDVDRFKFIESVKSPNGNYELNIYLNETSLSRDATVCEAKWVGGDYGEFSRVVYNDFKRDKDSIKWVSDSIVEINGEKLNIFKDCHDLRFWYK